MAGLRLDEIIAPITVAFKQRVANLIKIAPKGTVLYATQDSELTTDYTIQEFSSALNLNIDNETLKNKVKEIFEGGTSTVKLFTYKNALETYVETLKSTKFDWLVCDNEADQATVATYAKENKCFAAAYNIKADSMYVVNFTNPTVTYLNGNLANGIDYLPRIAGVLAGCPYDKSVSYKTFTDLKSVEIPANINSGEFLLHNDKDGIRVASPVNSLITLGEDITEDMKSICITEGMKRLETDVKYAFKNSYKGKHKNSYDNQCLFLSALNGYLEQLEQLKILDPLYNNYATIDVEAQRKAWLAIGKDEAAKWSETEVKNNTYKNLMFPLLDVKFLDAMEGMKMTVEMF